MKKHGSLRITAVVLSLCIPSLSVAGDKDNAVCYTIRESKSRGCFVCSVTFAQKEIKFKGKTIVIGEAWIEKKTERVGPLHLLPVYKTIPGYWLCFNLSRGWEELDSIDGFFWLENKGHSFAQIGTVVLCEGLKNLDQREFTVLLQDDKNDNIKTKITLNLPPEKE